MPFDIFEKIELELLIKVSFINPYCSLCLMKSVFLLTVIVSYLFSSYGVSFVCKLNPTSINPADTKFGRYKSPGYAEYI